MPRVTAKHEQQVRERILSAAVEVFSTIGYRRSTIADIVGASGLSVGAIYTYFTGKDELFFAACEQLAVRDQELLAARLPEGMDPTLRIAVAISTFIDQIDPARDGWASGHAIQAWAEVGQSEAVGATLRRRRENLVAIARRLIDEAIEGGVLPAWLDRDGLSMGVIALLDGLILDRTEQGEAWTRERATRQVFALIGPIMAAAAVAEPPELPALPPPGDPLPDVRI